MAARSRTKHSAPNKFSNSQPTSREHRTNTTFGKKVPKKTEHHGTAPPVGANQDRSYQEVSVYVWTTGWDSNGGDVSELWIAKQYEKRAAAAGGEEIGRPWRGDKEPKKLGPIGDDNYGKHALRALTTREKYCTRLRPEYRRQLAMLAQQDTADAPPSPSLAIPGMPSSWHHAM